MNKLATFDPFSVGFERMLERLNSLDSTSQTTTYPPYNIVKSGDTEYVIELAVAGFTEDDLDVEVKDGILTVSGNTAGAEEHSYIHRGIAMRSFVRKFTLADTVEAVGAQVINGMLQIRLINHIPEEKKPRKIPFVGKDKPKQFLAEEQKTV